jgi:DNA polymerase I-like protein with 3'-5' exonuclease and polymerase domains
MGYGAQPKKLKEACKLQANVDITIEQAQEAFDAFWGLYSGVNRFAERMKRHCNRNDGVIINDLNYRMFPKQANAAFNGWIQSTLSGVIDLFTWYFLESTPWARFVTCIHDSLMYIIPEDRIEEFRACKEEAEGIVNSILKWDSRIELGFNVGRNWAELK